MINKNSLAAAIGLATKVSKKGCFVTAIDGTPVASLVRAGYYPVPANEETSISAEERILQGSVLKNAAGVCEHDLVMDELVEVIAKTVSWNLDNARNQVNPVIKEAYTELEEFVQNAQSLKASQLNIIQDFYHPVWSSNYLAGMVDRYSETPVSDVRLSFAVPMPENVNEIDLISTGASRFNAELEALLASKQPGEVRELYNRVFVAGDDSYNPSLMYHLNYINGDRNNALLIHLFALKLLDNVPEGVKIPLPQYREYIASIVAQSGRTVYRILKKRESDAAQKVLITNWSQFKSDDIGVQPIEISVNSDVYNKWLEEGGSPEVIFGAFATDRNYSYVTLLERKEAYAEVWRRHERVMLTNIRLQKANHYLQGLQQAVKKQIQTIPADLLLSDRQVYINSLNDYIRKLPRDWYETDIYSSVRKVVCNVIFPHTDAYEILVAIDAAAKDNPDIDIREAGLLAVIEIVGTWVAKLLKVDKPVG